MDCFGEIDDAAEYEIFFANLYPHWFVSFCSFDFYVYFIIVIVVVGCDVVDSRGAYSLSLAFDVALDRFIRVGEILLYQAGCELGPRGIVAVPDCLEESFFGWKPRRSMVP